MTEDGRRMTDERTILPWIGIALLAVSWLFGLEYYHAVDWPAWAVTVVLGASLLAQLRGRLPSAGLSAAALAMVVPAAVIMPWPYCAAILLVIAGLVVHLLAWGLGQIRGAREIGRVRETHQLPSPPAPLPPAGEGSKVLERLAVAGVVAGLALLAQALALIAYEAMTARSHELPAPLPDLIAATGRMIGMEMSAEGTTLPTFTMRETHMLGATWELFFDPVTLGFVVGGLVLLAWKRWAEAGVQQLPPSPLAGERWTEAGVEQLPPSPLAGEGSGVRGQRWQITKLLLDRREEPHERRAWGALRDAGVLLAAVAAWLPLRAAIYVGIFLNGILRTDYEAPLNSVRLFWSPWIHLLLLGIPVLAAWRLLPLGSGRPAANEDTAGKQRPAASPGRRLRIAAAGLVALAALLWTTGLYWDPVGRRLPGRVVVEEYHPNREKIWEPTFKPFDTQWYGHLSGYNYYCIYDYLSRFYRMSRLNRPIDNRALDDCDVLVVKCPTREYSPREVDAVVRYVEQGGSVLLIGEHTNVFGSGTYLNQFAEKFGFRFRYDCLFGVDSVFDQHYVRPLVPHPSVQYVPWMEFATSDSIDPQQSTGRAAIQSTGLKNKTADYHVDNFYPPPNDTAAMRYGAFVQLWSMRYGRGKVLAFTDSTDFSNFCTFEPGKAEILLGMIEWLNHRTGGPDPRPWLMLAALALAAAGCWLGRRWQGAWLVLAAAAVLGWSAAVPAVRTAHAWALPEPKPVRPMVQVVMDQTLSDVILPKNGFISGKEEGFGIFERWILRLGYFTSRREGADAFRGNLLVIVYPSKPLPEGFREQLVDYVTAGGKVLVLDSPENRKSTADDLLSPFGLSVDRAKAYRGDLRSEGGWPGVPIATAYPVRGGRSFAWLGKHPVAATAPCGKGSVTVLGFGSRFCDYSMGVTGDVVPDENLKQVYAVEFSLLRRIVEGKK